jgi:hypothetical protein
MLTGSVRGQCRGERLFILRVGADGTIWSDCLSEDIV